MSLLAVITTSVPDARQYIGVGTDEIFTLFSTKLATRDRLLLAVNEYDGLVDTSVPFSVQFTKL